MASTSAIVNRSLRKYVVPLLRDSGFEKIDARNAWRWQEKVVFVFHIRAVGNYFSEVTGWPPGSISVWLGAYYTFMPNTHFVKTDSKKRLLPVESECHVRNGLDCRINKHRQLDTLSNPAERNRNDIWWVEPNGSNADAVALDVKESILEVGLDWYRNCTDLENVLSALENDRDCYSKYEKAAYLSRELGDIRRWEKYSSRAEEEGKRIGTEFKRVET